MGQALSKKMKHKRSRLGCKSIRNFDTKEKYFIKNGGILLEKQIALSQGRNNIAARQLKIFSNEDIKKATNNYDPELIILSSNNDGVTIYKGTFENHVVSIISPHMHKPDPKLIDIFLTGASTRMVTYHENMLTVYGCCLETYIPLLVCEFFSNGTLFQHIHHGDIAAPRKPMKWGDRFRVATEVAYALSYLHNALSKPVVHRQVSSLSIYLDSSFHAKLSKFGYAVAIDPGDTSQKWSIQGTMGYIDPEYVETREVTDKCDVYSFGVLLLELLTRRQPLVSAGGQGDLVNAFVTAVESDCMMEMIDCEVLGQASKDEIQQVAQLALACVAKKGYERPTMVDIVSKLWKIQGRKKA